ncbi:glycosyltransferase family 4 protein [Butyrivibrio sp. LB2008]|uniref:glycosyltransferase family 4 protein n=1 Tax=Butyrivibrio sp. LB2008 TaxID=1408305 RepID=UPI00047DC464|nr:glycosyltransferase family 4 protein [Butyrivibrio sp. LB2008]
MNVGDVCNKIKKKHNVLLSTEVSEMTAGIAYSFLGLAVWLEENTEYHVVALLKKKGALYNNLKSKGIETHVVMQNKKWLKWSEKENVSMRLIKELVRPFLVPFEVILLRRLMRRSAVEIVHINGITGGMCGETAIGQGLPVVWHIREFLEEDLNGEFQNKKKAIEIINQSKRIIAVSEAVKKKYSAILKPNIDVVYNGFDIGKVSHLNRSIGDKFKICMLGRIIRGKGQIDLVRAIGLLSDEDKEKCEVHFIGFKKDKKYYEELEVLINSYGIGQNIFFDGYISNAYEQLADYKCICICSTKEAFGRTTIEGMLNGCIVIGADTGGTVELVQDMITGMTYKCGDAENLAQKISFCINNPELVNSIAYNGYNFARSNFQMDKTYSKIVEIYEQCVKS